MIQRIISYFIILLSILFLPYWLYVPIIIAAILINQFFWEAILFGFLIDSLYGYGVEFSTPRFVSVYALAALVLIIAAMFFKERLRLHV